MNVRSPSTSGRQPDVTNLATWFMSFLNDRSHFVNINLSSSFIGHTNAGTPQGTLSGPIDFKVMTDDLAFDQLLILNTLTT